MEGPWQDEALLRRASSVFEDASRSGGKGDQSRGHISRSIVQQLIRVGADESKCTNADDFAREAVRFCKGFSKHRGQADALFTAIRQSAKALQRENSGSVVASSAAAETDADFDRAFYDVEGGAGNEAGEFLGSEERWKAREQHVMKSQQMTKHAAARARENAFNRDQSAWENNLMYRSGVKTGRTFDLDTGAGGGQEDNQRTHVIVHNIRPSFLRADDKVYSLENAPDSCKVVRDDKSDMAKAAVKGSAAVIRIRETNVRIKMTHKYWELGGSRIGKAIGVSKEGDEAVYGQSAEAVAEEKLVKALSRNEATSSSSPPKGKTLSAREEIARVRQSLPVCQVRTELLRVVRNNQVVVIVGETGSGKTTQLTQYLREDGYSRIGNQRMLIGCTQPRRVAAMSVAKRVADEVGCELGQEVGYSIRFEDMTSECTEIKYMTDGVLMRETLTSADLDKYSCVVMDEAHERSLFTDVLFGILKKVVASRLDFKLIVTSATMDADRFARFFGGAATFHIPGRTFKVDTFFAKATQADYVEAAAKKALEIHLGSPPGDILIFMTGQEDITATCQLISEKVEALDDGGATSGVPELLLLPMFSQLPSDMQARIFNKAKPGQRKCIVSTNIAETSLTVDGIKYVIDSGFCKLKVFNPRIGIDALRITPISQANANQRSGRAGRTSEGTCWRLYTLNQFSRELLPAQIPEIQRTNLGNVVLLLKSLGVKDLLSFDFMDPPPKDNIVNSMYQLWVLGALGDRGDLTELGRRMGKFPCDPPLAKMLISAQQLGCLPQVLTVVSMLSVPEVFYRPAERAEESDLARERFFVPESDHLTLLNVYNLVEKHGFSGAWCAKHFVHLKSVIKARDVRAQLEALGHNRDKEEEGGAVAKSTSRSGTLSTPSASWDLVRKAICSAYFVHAAKLKSITEYVNLLNGTPANLHPSSAICGIGETPDYVVYHELVLTSKEYMRTVTAIDPQWLAELGPMFFSIKGATKRNRDQGQDITRNAIVGAPRETFEYGGRSATAVQAREMQFVAPVSTTSKSKSSMKLNKPKKKRRGL